MGGMTNNFIYQVKMLNEFEFKDRLIVRRSHKACKQSCLKIWTLYVRFHP